eukprot:315109-Heterocapsa_arctica.AAC.1
MTTIGGQGMAKQLTAPAHNLSRTLARNLVQGDTAFLHHPRCISGMPPAKPHSAAQQATNRAIPEELRKEADMAAALAKTLTAHISTRTWEKSSPTLTWQKHSTRRSGSGPAIAATWDPSEASTM